MPGDLPPVGARWVLARYGPDPVEVRHFLADDRESWVARFDEAWRGSLDEVEEEIQRRITRNFYDDEGNSYHPIPEDGVLLRRGVDVP